MLKEDLKRQTTFLSEHYQVYVDIYMENLMFVFPVLQGTVVRTNRMVPISPAPNFGLLSHVVLSEEDRTTSNS